MVTHITDLGTENLNWVIEQSFRGTLAAGSFNTDVVGGFIFLFWHEVTYSALVARDLN
jgi:hypothetical protein